MKAEYFEIVERRYFKKTGPEGKVIFYPYGSAGNGYELTSICEKKVRHIFRRHAATIAVIIVFGSLFSVVPVSFLASLAVGFVLILVNRFFYLYAVGEVTRHLLIFEVGTKPNFAFFGTLATASVKFLFLLDVLLAILFSATIWFLICGGTPVMLTLAIVNGLLFIATSFFLALRLFNRD